MSIEKYIAYKKFYEDHDDPVEISAVLTQHSTKSAEPLTVLKDNGTSELQSEVNDEAGILQESNDLFDDKLHEIL